MVRNHHGEHPPGTANSTSWASIAFGSKAIRLGDPVGPLAFIEAIEAATGLTAEKIFKPMLQGDVVETFADAGLLKALTGFVPQTRVEEGVRRFVEWYQKWR